MATTAVANRCICARAPNCRFRAWISRVWFLTHRGAMNDDPVKFALTDRRSWLCALAVGGVAVAARYWPS